MTAFLTRTTTILQLDRRPHLGLYGSVPFKSDGTDENTRNHEFFLDRRVWEDLGSPIEITVTVEPGDKLN